MPYLVFLTFYLTFFSFPRFLHLVVVFPYAHLDYDCFSDFFILKSLIIWGVLVRYFAEYPSDRICLIISSRLNWDYEILGGKPYEGKQHFHRITASIHIINMIYHCWWYWPWSTGWGSVGEISPLHLSLFFKSPLFVLYSL